MEAIPVSGKHDPAKDIEHMFVEKTIPTSLLLAMVGWVLQNGKSVVGSRQCCFKLLNGLIQLCIKHGGFSVKFELGSSGPMWVNMNQGSLNFKHWTTGLVLPEPLHSLRWYNTGNLFHCADISSAAGSLLDMPLEPDNQTFPLRCILKDSAQQLLNMWHAEQFVSWMKWKIIAQSQSRVSRSLSGCQSSKAVTLQSVSQSVSLTNI